VFGRKIALVIGDVEVARRTCAALEARGWAVRHVLQPTDAELQGELAGGVDAVAVLVRGDISALRYALLVEHLQASVRLVVTLFDRTIADQVTRAVRNCVVTSPADSAMPAILGACVGRDVLAVRLCGGEPAQVVRQGLDGIVETPWEGRRSVWRRAGDWIRSQLHPHDVSSRILVAGALGLLTVLASDWLLSAVALHETGLHALWAATRVVATVGPAGDRGIPGWYIVFSSASMLVTIALTAIFTAGVVNRAHSSRSTVLVGLRTVPTRDHVVVVGLGQVGLRLCMRLRELGLPVVAVERDPCAVNLRLARRANIPVLIAHAEDRAVLQRLALPRARALAAMGADDLDNVEVAIAALAVSPELRVVLRAGESDVIAETRSLFTIGRVCDVSAATAIAVTSSLLELTGQEVLCADGTILERPAADSSSARSPRTEAPTETVNSIQRCECR
jgi:voltage-gated potassium channel Kch